MSRVHVAVAASLLTLIACGGDGYSEAECKAMFGSAAAAPGDDKPAAPAAAPAASGGGESMSAFEKSVVGPVLEDLRAGVRPFTDEGIGVCKGQGRDCEGFMGLEAGELPPGKYMIRAEVRVPKQGEWKIDFSTECTTTKKTASGSSSSTNNYNKTHEVSYVGEERGSRLSPLYKIDSPNPGGDKECTYKIVAPHPDGDKVYEGSFKVPGKE